MVRFPIWQSLILLLLIVCFHGCTNPQSPAAAKEDPKPQGLLLRDYQPKSMLVTEQHHPEKAKFPVIDNHNHLRESDPEQCIRAMDATGVVQVVNLDGGWGDTLKQNIAKFEKKYPGRFLTYALVDWSKIDEPNFGSKAASQLETDVKAGAHGLKIHKTLGLAIKDKTGKIVPVDDPRIDPIWAKCAELKIPVEIHIGDPAAFFTPLDKFNERYEELEFHPDWLFYPNFPSLEQILEQGEHVYSRHPKTTFIGAHVGSQAENLKAVSTRLDKYPNYYVDIDARLSELGRQPYSARKFLIKYQDRVMFGTDTAPDAEAYRLHWRFLETEDEYFDIAKSHHFQGRWMVTALNLPDPLLQKLYHKNAMKLIPGAAVK
jgi:uncharacterized protein